MLVKLNISISERRITWWVIVEWCLLTSPSVNHDVNYGQHDGNYVTNIHGQHDHPVHSEIEATAHIFVVTVIQTAGHEEPAEANFDEFYDAPSQGDQFDDRDEQTRLSQAHARLIAVDDQHAQR
uniref:Secreted protein n=1 Tax=Romanomermis culicivorax TaxID=13658 RepID=A0A915JMX6_ROMCU